MKLQSTPIEKYNHKGWVYWVKREDTCVNFPGPPFSKIRGLMKVLLRLKKEGKTHIGYTETSVSMAGWGVAYGCWLLGLNSVIFDPQYKGEHAGKEVLRFHRRKWNRFGAEIIPIKAGMARVNYNIARKILAEKYRNKSKMLPLGLPFKETIQATTEEVRKTRKNHPLNFNTVIVNVGSGTIASGVVNGFRDKTIYGIMGRTGDVKRKLRIISKKGNFMTNGMTGVDFRLIDPGWEYTEPCKISIPFPCHPYYDAKAYDWMIKNKYELKLPVLFWNIGALPSK